MTMPTFSAGQRVTGAELQAVVNTVTADAPFTPIMVTDVAGATTTSTTYTATVTGGASSFSTTFVAAATSHTITVSAFIVNAGASGPFSFYLAPVVTGSGFVTYGPNDTDAAIGQYTNTSTPGGTATRSTVVTGLTVGVTYTVTLQQKVGGSTGDFVNRRIIIS